MDPVGVISLVYDVSKDLYTYYQAVKECDTDIKELRTQLLQLQHTSDSLAKAIKRDGLRAEDKTQVEEATAQCEDAAEELKSALDKIRLDGAQPQNALAKLKAVGRKAVYPFKKSTILGLAEDTETCQDALQIAISILQLNVSATTVEQLQRLDEKLVAGTATLEASLRSLELHHDAAKDEIVQHLLQHRKLLTDEEQRRKASAIVESLTYPEMNNRRREVSEAHDSSLGWLFTNESQGYPQITSLLRFLNEESGLFWIQGKPASGKSTFMKYLLNRNRGRDKLWEWAGTRDVVFPSHFCWIAGATMQKTQQGMLRALLHQVLAADLALVPIACPSQWDARASHSSWYEKELWDCLYTAVTASDKRFCFFIDGLDEVEPEKDHIALAKAITRLSSHGNVKVVTSSRPWSAFERILQHDGRVLRVEDINRFSIINYIRTELEANTTDESFSYIDWDCIRARNRCPAETNHKHEDAHNFVQAITQRAEGVFLWVALVMEAVRRHLMLGCPIPVLSSYVDKFPTELEEYFRTMIFKRIHESLLSETAMALRIALLDGTCLNSFALLCDYTETGESRLIDADFVSVLPCSTRTSDELANIARKTLNFLRGCCRDIIATPDDTITPSGHYNRPITFTHRTIFDHLCTPEMQGLLENHVPKHFMKAFFEYELAVASHKMMPNDSGDLSIMYSCFGRLTWAIESQSNSTRSKLAVIAEEVALHNLESFQKLLTMPEYDSAYLPYNCTRLSAQLAVCGLCSFSDSVMKTAPHLLASAQGLTQSLQLTTFLFDIGDRRMHVDLLRRLLQAGLDINTQPTFYTIDNAPTAWRLFLELLRQRSNVPPKRWEEWAPMSAERRLEALDGFDDEIGRDLYSDRYIQDAIKLFVEFGADLEPQDIESLTTCLPKPDGHSYDWPEFLHAYSQPRKRAQLQRDRRNRIRRWPEVYLSGRDRKLLKIPPDLSESWWSRRGRRLLELD